ncbi:MAG: hypothetical protein IPM54_04005 [Polyangiaceae bacterium]|nr:hypothetical protein [Polyangiaceae bacterium]
MNPERTVFYGGGRVIAGGLVAFVLGGAALVFGALTRPQYVYHAYLSAFAWILSTALGALIFLMIVHAMDAKWPVAIRRVVESIVGILPLTIVLFIPIAIGVERIFPWTHPEAAHDAHMHELLEHQRPYLNTPSFFVRAALYFALWIGAGMLLRKWSLRQDMAPNIEQKTRSRILSVVALFPVSLALTFASFDWLMSLTPSWYSTMFGVYWFAGGFVGAISLIVLVTAFLQEAGMLARVTRSHYYALGRLMLAFTIFWAYAAYFQLFLIWITDKPQEVVFYTMRATKEWLPFSIALAVIHFVLPFFVLLSYRVKQSPRTLAPIAAWVLLAHWVDMEWLVMPAVRPMGPVIHWTDVAAFVCLGGAAFAFGAYRLRGHSIFPKNDPAIDAAFRYESM